MSDELRKAAQDVVSIWEEGNTDNDPIPFLDAMEVLRIVLLFTCRQCGKPTPEGSVHTCSPQKHDAKQRLLEIMRRNGLATGHGDTLTQVIDELESELTDVLSAARQNAARYRWLRDVSDTEFMEELSDTFFGEWDAVIDAAMQQEQGE